VQRLDWKPARRPERVPLEGETVRLEPVDPDRHAGDLFASSEGAPGLWDYLAYGPFPSQGAFTEWLKERASSRDPLFYAVVDRETGSARGMASLMRIDPENGVIETGHIWFSPVLQRTRQATEAIFLLARYSFDNLGYRRFEWKCDSLNQPSRRAAERFGFVFEGVFRQHMVIKGRNRDTAWFSMLDGEWPLVRAGFETWLSPENFDPAGRQHRSLAEVRDSLSARNRTKRRRLKT
jgi:RimJ/RimL family protein N-acetyltransferase